MDYQRPMDAAPLGRMSALALAYVGDAVYDQYVRTFLAIHHPDHSAHALHEMATRIVCASAQARTIRCILCELTQREQRIYRRGRNANAGTVPKNANVGDYRAATGFEAVLGYLHLKGEASRLIEILSLARTKGWKENGYGEDKP